MIKQFGKYILLERYSMGGMAEVYRAKLLNQPFYDKFIAVKRILPNLAAEADFIAMFIDEAKIAAELDHPNICQLYELGRMGNAHYIAMEFIQGRDLATLQSHYRRKKRIMSISQSCYIVAKIAQGLDYAHRYVNRDGVHLNIIHRDVSPPNVVVGYDGAIKLIDFGIAKAATKSSKTQFGVLKGKYAYMSPELIVSQNIDHRSDLFSLGVIFWELLTGRRLFEAENEFAVLEKVTEGDIVPPSSYNRVVPAFVDNICMKALQRNVNERYQNAREMAEDLQRFIDSCEPSFTKSHLQNWMCTHFVEELKQEWDKLPIFKNINTAEDIANYNAQHPENKERFVSYVEDSENNPDWRYDPNEEEITDRTLNELFAQTFDFGRNSDDSSILPNPDKTTTEPYLPADESVALSFTTLIDEVEEDAGAEAQIYISGVNRSVTSNITGEVYPLNVFQSENTNGDKKNLNEGPQSLSSLRRASARNAHVFSFIGAALICLIGFTATFIGITFFLLPSLASSPDDNFTKVRLMLNVQDDSALILPENASRALIRKIDGGKEYEISNILPGELIVSISHDSYQSERFSIFVPEEGGRAKAVLSHPLPKFEELTVILPFPDALLMKNGEVHKGTGVIRTIRCIKGEHLRLTAAKQGYFSESIEVIAGEQQEVSFNLKRASVMLNIRSKPDEAMIQMAYPPDYEFVDITTTPISFGIEDTSLPLRIRISKENYEDWTSDITFDPETLKEEIKIFSRLKAQKQAEPLP